jgi:serine/alanine adding enzyme
MNIRIVNSLPEDVWRRFVNDQPAGNIFHTPEMFEAFSRAQGHDPKFWAVLDTENILALFLPVEISMAGGLLKPFTTRAVAYGSILFPSDRKMDNVINDLLQNYKQTIKNQVLFTELRNLRDNCDLQPMIQSAGFEFAEHNNYIVDLDLPID